MGVAHIIRRKVGVNRYAFAYIHDGESRVDWKDAPGEATRFPSEEKALQYKKEHKKQFDYDDQVAEYRPYDGCHCQFCSSTYVQCIRTEREPDQGELKAIIRCCNCTKEWTERYNYAGHNY
jgi:hypothetical protein